MFCSTDILLQRSIRAQIIVTKNFFAKGQTHSDSDTLKGHDPKVWNYEFKYFRFEGLKSL